MPPASKICGQASLFSLTKASSSARSLSTLTPMIFKSVAVILVVDGVQVGQVGFHRRGPARPEDDEHRLAAISRRIDRFVLQAGSLERRATGRPGRAGGVHRPPSCRRRSRRNPATSLPYCSRAFFSSALNSLALARWSKTAGTSSEFGELFQEIVEVGHPLLLVGEDIRVRRIVTHRKLGVDPAVSRVRAELAAAGDDLVERFLALRQIGRCAQRRPGCRRLAC